MGDKAESSDEEPTIAEDVVVTKYKMAGEMTNRVMAQVLSSAVEGASILELCELGDRLIIEETGKVYKKEKELKKGIAFPTCVSVNNCVCHFSPLRSDALVKLKNGDVLKIELGAHVDGFIAVAAHTKVVGSSMDNKVTGRKADVIQAAYTAAEVALRMVVPGGDNLLVTEAIQKTATSFKCQPIEGILSHQLKRNMYDSEKCILLNPSEAHRKEYKQVQFELHEAYAIDILVSTGDGKAKQLDTRTTVFRRTEDLYNLKMKASRAFYSDISSKFDVMPFSLRSCEDEGKARMGVVECINHNLVEPYNVLYEKEGEFVAQFKFTVLLMPNGPQKITSIPFDQEAISSSLSLQDQELKTLLATSTARKSKKKKKKTKASSTKDVPPAAELPSSTTGTSENQTPPIAEVKS